MPVTGLPRDTSERAYAEQLAALKRLEPEERVRVALELSEAVRSIQIDGILARNPGWTREEAARHLVADRHGPEIVRGA